MQMTDGQFKTWLSRQGDGEDEDEVVVPGLRVEVAFVVGGAPTGRRGASTQMTSTRPAWHMLSG